jgi:glycosyltransferase involved in cell wall biosynthesis
VHILGHSLTVNPTKETFENRQHILFVGAIHDDYSPNADSIVWFAENVLPEINKILESEVKFIVAGFNKSSRVATLASEQIVITGKLDNLDALYSASRIFVAPTRFAAGIPHKVHEAAAKGIPVVSTSLLASGLGWQDGVELLVADSPEDFAKSCVRLYCDSVLWEKLRLNALKRVEVDCSEQVFRENLKAILSSSRTP